MAIREIKIKTTLWFHLTWVRMAKINRTDDKYCWGCGEKEPLIHHWCECQSVWPPWKPERRILKVLLDCRILRPSSGFQVCRAKAFSCWAISPNLAFKSHVTVDLLALKAGVLYSFVCVRGWKAEESLLTGEVLWVGEGMAAVLCSTQLWLESPHTFSNTESPISKETSLLISSDLWLSTSSFLLVISLSLTNRLSQGFLFIPLAPSDF